MTPEQVDRLERLYDLAAEVLGSAEEAERWMHASKLALDSQTPVDSARTEAGARKVEEILLRIEYGVYG